MTGLWVVPCGAAKLEAPAPAAQLYSSSHFRLVLEAARAAAGDDSRVRILSARHGLLQLDQLVAPYDLTMRDAGAVSSVSLSVQLRFGGDGWLQAGTGELVNALLPRAYRERLEPALRDVDAELVDHYAGARGIGDQRRIAAELLRTSSRAAS